MNIWTKLPEKMHAGGLIKQGNINNAQVMGSVAGSEAPIHSNCHIYKQVKERGFCVRCEKVLGPASLFDFWM